jgi:hypothetical protein
MKSAQRGNRTATRIAALGQNQIGAGRIRQQQLLERRTCGNLKSPPLFNGNQHGGINAATGHDLGAFRNADIQKFAEPGFRVLNRPSLHDDAFDLTRWMTSLVSVCGKVNRQISGINAPETQNKIYRLVKNNQLD